MSNPFDMSEVRRAVNSIAPVSNTFNFSEMLQSIDKPVEYGKFGIFNERDDIWAGAIKYKFVAVKNDGTAITYGKRIVGVLDEDGNVDFPMKTYDIVKEMMRKLPQSSTFSPGEANRIAKELVDELMDMPATKIEKGVRVTPRGSQVPYKSFQLKYVER